MKGAELMMAKMKTLAIAVPTLYHHIIMPNNMPDVTAWNLYQSNDCIHWVNEGMYPPGTNAVIQSLAPVYYQVQPAILTVDRGYRYPAPNP
jgi:hypothetical protein